MAEAEATMVVGSETWFKALAERVTFPAKIAFYYGLGTNTKEKEHFITSTIIKSKAKLPNVRWTDIEPSNYFFSVSGPIALIGVYDIATPEAYLEAILNMQRTWTPEDVFNTETSEDIVEDVEDSEIVIDEEVQDEQ